MTISRLAALRFTRSSWGERLLVKSSLPGRVRFKHEPLNWQPRYHSQVCLRLERAAVEAWARRRGWRGICSDLLGCRPCSNYTVSQEQQRSCAAALPCAHTHARSPARQSRSKPSTAAQAQATTHRLPARAAPARPRPPPHCRQTSAPRRPGAAAPRALTRGAGSPAQRRGGVGTCRHGYSTHARTRIKRSTAVPCRAQHLLRGPTLGPAMAKQSKGQRAKQSLCPWARHGSAAAHMGSPKAAASGSWAEK
jgi:hypothetical protein